MNKVCVITGTRAEYGLLRPLIKKISEDNELQLQLIATGMHLSPEFGLTYKEIEKDGFVIDEKIEALLSSDTPIGITKSMGLAMIGFADVLERLKPDMVVLLGDRYEIFAAASAATVFRIPIAHIHGGETTEGAFDEAFRHSITKMSYFHFTSAEEYRERVIQLGESPDRVLNVGAIGLESIKTLKLLSKSELEQGINFKLGLKTALVTFHPVTLEKSTTKGQFENLLKALAEIRGLRIIFTKANSDTDGRIVNKMIDEYVQKNKETSIAFTSMGQLKYLSSLQYVGVVVGNSSSGIIEVPSFKIPTVNIGERQKGRIQSKSIINSKTDRDSIKGALKLALSAEFRNEIKDITNPYGDGNVAEKIITEIKKGLSKSVNLKKSFYNLEK